MFKEIKKIYQFHKGLYLKGKSYAFDLTYCSVAEASRNESEKHVKRFDVINFLLDYLGRDTTYIEIGTRNPEHNFDKIRARMKYSVDPGIEFEDNPVDFPYTSDEFFEKVFQENLLIGIEFDVIFIDGLHLAEQVQRDIYNSLKVLKEDGFLVLHDCNPPTEYHAREQYSFFKSPASGYWNGTTWKAFYKARLDKELSSCCIDTDWGVGIITKRKLFKSLEYDVNPFFEFKIFEQNRVELNNLMSFDYFKVYLLNKGGG